MIVIKNSRLRNILKIIIPFVLIPAVVLCGALIFDEKRYAFISLAVVMLSLALFVTGFENKRIGTRRMVLISIFTALSVIGRFLPLFNPVTAITILGAVYLGGEAGFLIGALSGVISNFYFGQGPWTPFQMFAWGMIGLMAGYLSKYLKKSKALCIAYGVISGAVFSLIMDIWTVLWYNGNFEPRLYLTALATSLPHLLRYAVSNAVFLFLFFRPFGEKLTRIKKKYGL